MTVSQVMSRSIAAKKSSSSRRGWIIGAVVVLVAFVLLVLSNLLLPQTAQTQQASIANSRPNGAKAIAQVLRNNGISITQVLSLDAAVEAAKPDSTLAIMLYDELSAGAIDRLNAVPADLVIVTTVPWYSSTWSNTVEKLTGGAVTTSFASGFSADALEPSCVALEATRAGHVTGTDKSSLWVMAYDSGLIQCYPDKYGDPLYADLELPTHRVTILAGDQFVMNHTITNEGNGALALGVLGRHENLTWYLPGTDAFEEGPESTSLDPRTQTWVLMPGWVPPVLALMLIAAAAAAVWRGRRFGSLVPENLPVAVPAAETTTGLGRLYRQSRASGHAGAALRAATIARIAARIGIPTSASTETVVQRIAGVANHDPHLISSLLYGPPPGSDTELLALANNLARLESDLGIPRTPSAESEHR